MKKPLPQIGECSSFGAIRPVVLGKVILTSSPEGLCDKKNSSFSVAIAGVSGGVKLARTGVNKLKPFSPSSPALIADTFRIRGGGSTFGLVTSK